MGYFNYKVTGYRVDNAAMFDSLWRKDLLFSWLT